MKTDGAEPPPSTCKADALPFELCWIIELKISCCYLYSIFSNIWGLRDSNPFYFYDSFRSEGLEPSLPSVDPRMMQVWYRTPARVELVGNGSQTRFVPAGHPVPSFFNAHIEGHFMSLCYFFVSSFQMLYETIDYMFMVTPLRFELRIFAVKGRCVYRFHYGAI